MITLKIGADPEVFVQRRKDFISGHEFPCGTKEKPRLVAHGAVQCDGMALEFNVNPSTTRREFINNTIRVYRDLEKIVKETDPEATLVAQPTVEFGKEYIDLMPRHVSELGCNPDFNAYTGEPNPIPDREQPFRTGSGHVHVGFCEGEDPEDPDHFEMCREIVKEMDYFVGLPSLVWDRDQKRRDLYGKAGAFRPKSYGFEYRTLSNAWLNDPETIAIVFDQTKRCVDRMFNSKAKPLHLRYGDRARELINQGAYLWSKAYQNIAAAVYA